MDITALYALYQQLTETLPLWAALALIGVFGAASAVTNMLPTPSRPEDGASRRAWTAWIGYRIAETVAMVGRRAKERPDEAARLVRLAHLAAALPKTRPEQFDVQVNALTQALDDLAQALRR